MEKFWILVSFFVGVTNVPFMTLEEKHVPALRPHR